MQKRPGGSPVRLIDVARAANVSLTTASFAMSGRSGVSEPVAARVRAIAAELGYVPNMQARSLASGASSTIGLVVHDLADPYFAELAAAVVGSAKDLGLMVQVSQSSRDLTHELQQVRSLVASRVLAIIMAGSGRVRSPEQEASYDELERYQATGGRVATIGRHRSAFDAVVPQNREAGRLIGAHFVELGHEHLGIAAGPTQLVTALDRLRGVRAALDEAGIPRDQVHVSHTAFTHAGGAEATRELLARDPRITGIIALNDAMAAGVLAALRDDGRSVPGDVSVSGVDDVAVAADLGPGLTTIRYPLQLMGELAVKLALKPPGTRPRREPVPGTLVARGSTAPPAGSGVARLTQTG